MSFGIVSIIIITIGVVMIVYLGYRKIKSMVCC